MNQGGKEMEDRGGGIGMLQTRNGQLDSEYTIGSYVPEISMEDGEDEQPGKSKHIEYTNGGPEKV